MPTDEQYQEKAVEVYAQMGDVIIPKNLSVDRYVGGAWVKIEVWVSDDEFNNENGQFGVGA